MIYQNPILPGFCPDPSICRVGEDYYLVVSSFEYFPGLPIFHSRDLVHWRQIGHCLTRESQLNLKDVPCSDGLYAPTIRHHQGRFYVACTNKIPDHGFCNFFVHTTDPAGPWSEPVVVAQGGIDPSLWFDECGKVYWTGNGSLWAPIRGIYQSEIDIATGKLLTEIQLVWRGTGGAYPESPHLFKRGDYYYLIIAEGGTADCHMVSVARSSHPFGPFVAGPNNPVLTQRSTMNEIQATGHADFFEDHLGQWWAVFLGIRYSAPGFHILGRETFLAPVDWTPEGWPVVHAGQNITTTMDVPRELPAHPWPTLPVRDDFDAPQLAFSWVFLRNPKPDDCSLTARPGALRLHCSPVTLNELDSPAFIGRRQQHKVCRVATVVDFNPASENEEAGLTALIDHQHHAECVITRRNNERVALLRRRIGTLVEEKTSEPLPPGPIILTLDADAQEYRFGFKSSGKTVLIGAHEMRYLSTEVAGGYSGVVLGLYASSNGQRSQNYADFDWFEYEEVKTQVKA